MDDSYSKEFHSSGNNFGEEHLKKRNSSACKSSEEIRKAVEVCLLSSSCTLDVSGKNIKHLTEEIYRLPKIKYFHLERNVISTIPEDLFQKLPHLVWLDLRYNNIQALPPGIGYHRKTICHIDNFITVVFLMSLDKSLLLTPAVEDRKSQHMAIENSAFRKESYKRATHRTWKLNFVDSLEFPPKDVIQKGLKCILSFLRDSGNGKLLCMEPATSEMPPVEKLNLSELLQSSLDLSVEWPNEEEKLIFQKLKEEIIKGEKEEFLPDEQLEWIRTRRANLADQSQEFLKDLVQRVLPALRSFRCSWMAQILGNKTLIPKNAPYATDNISYDTMKEGAEKLDHTPEIREERMLKVKDAATRSLREKKLEQRIEQHTMFLPIDGVSTKETDV